MTLPASIIRHIPESNFDFRGMPRNVAKSDAIEDKYSLEQNGTTFHGCFTDDRDSPRWMKAAKSYSDAKFEDETEGPVEFSEIFDSLPAAEYNVSDLLGDDAKEGQHVYTQCAYDAFDRDTVHKFDRPYTLYQDFGICVDASNKQQCTQMLGIRAMDPDIQEILEFLAAHYAYAERGYCRHGWTMGECANVNIKNGWCPATKLEVTGWDWRKEDQHEHAVALAPLCRSGLPEDIKEWTRDNFMYEPGAITYFDGRTDALKRLFANKGVIHHGSNHTSSSSRPNRLRRIGGHAQTALGGDWSERTLRFFKDKGVSYDVDDFPCPQHQTWGPGWSGAVAAEYWPEWWGEKPEGAWLISSKQLLQYFDGYAYLPKMQGIPGGDPPLPPTPETNSLIKGNISGRLFDGNKIAIDGTVTVDGKKHIVRPVPGQPGQYEFVRRIF